MSISTQTPSSATPIMDVVGETSTEVNSRSTEVAVLRSNTVTQKRKHHKTGINVSIVVLYALIVSIGGIIGGYSHGFPSPTLIDLQIEYDKGERVTAFPGSCFYAGLFGVKD